MSVNSNFVIIEEVFRSDNSFSSSSLIKASSFISKTKLYNKRIIFLYLNLLTLKSFALKFFYLYLPTLTDGDLYSSSYSEICISISIRSVPTENLYHK